MIFIVKKSLLNDVNYCEVVNDSNQGYRAAKLVKENHSIA